MTTLQFVCIVLLPLISCYTFQMESNVEFDPHVLKYFCNYNEEGVYTRVELDTTYRNTEKCYECDCTNKMYSSCVGIGYNGGSFSVQGCKLKKLANCDFVFVKDDDETQIC